MRNYNKTRYSELVEEQIKAEARGIYWYNDGENREKWMELTNYNIVLSDYLAWVKREKFLVIIEKFLSNTIEFEQFEDEFSKLWVDTRRKVDKCKQHSTVIKIINPDPRSDSFWSLMTAIYRGFEAVEDEESTKEELKIFVKDLLIKKKLKFKQLENLLRFKRK